VRDAVAHRPGAEHADGFDCLYGHEASGGSSSRVSLKETRKEMNVKRRESGSFPVIARLV
jgi:hypothetical protein